MSDDLTQKLPGDQESIATQDNDRINVLTQRGLVNASSGSAATRETS